MKTLLNSATKGTLTFSALVILSLNANAASTTASTLYNGERVGLFELPEIEIVSTKLPIKESNRFELPGNKDVVTKEVNLPEVEITASRDQNSNGQLYTEEFIPVKYEIGNSSLEKKKEEFTIENPKVKSTDESDKPTEFKKRPRISFIANKIVSAGIEFLLKINDGLFFKS